MKNLISPETLAFFKQSPTPFKQIVDFLDAHPDISTVTISKLAGISSQKIYDYKYRSQKKEATKGRDTSVIPKNASKNHNRYSAEDKYTLIEKYIGSNDVEKAELLRKYGIYQSDIDRWKCQAKEASLLALGKRKERSDKQNTDQKKIEELENELKVQEKTTAKLSALLILQKKTFDMLKKND